MRKNYSLSPFGTSTGTSFLRLGGLALRRGLGPHDVLNCWRRTVSVGGCGVLGTGMVLVLVLTVITSSFWIVWTWHFFRGIVHFRLRKNLSHFKFKKSPNHFQWNDPNCTYVWWVMTSSTWTWTCLHHTGKPNLAWDCAAHQWRHEKGGKRQYLYSLKFGSLCLHEAY